MRKENNKNILVNRKNRMQQKDRRQSEDKLSRENYEVGFLFADVLRYGSNEEE